MPPQSKRSLSVLRELLAFTRPYKARLLGAVIALVFTAFIVLSIGQGIRLLIDQGFVAASMERLNASIAIIAALTLLMASGTFVRFYLISWLGERISADIRSAVFKHLITLQPGFYEENRSGEIMSRLTTDTTLLQSIIGSSFSMALRSSLTLCGALIMLLATNLKLSLLVLACVPAVLLPLLLIGRRVKALSRESQDSIANVGNIAGEAIQNIKTVQSFTRESEETEAFNREVEKAFAVARRRVRQRAALIATVIIMVFGALAVMLWVGGSDVLQGTMTEGELGAFVFYALLVGTAVATLSEVFSELQRAAGATERLVTLMHQPNKIQAPPGQAISATTLKAHLRFEKVSFYYPSRPEGPALKNFTLEIESGRCLALVGASGAGKSTVFELLQRFHDPQSGRVTIDDTDIRELDPSDLRRQIAVVSQQPALFSADVAYNIRYGRPTANPREVEDAARAAHAHDFIVQLPKGYRSFLGEKGVRLSGGQSQRIAIARALIKSPRILLLDEATSALDAESEHQVQLAIQELMRNRTTIIIAHRLSTVLHADHIAVLHHGEIVAQGKHETLLNTSERYRRLAQLQFQAADHSIISTHSSNDQSLS